MGGSLWGTFLSPRGEMGWRGGEQEKGAGQGGWTP